MSAYQLEGYVPSAVCLLGAALRKKPAYCLHVCTTGRQSALTGDTCLANEADLEDRFSAEVRELLKAVSQPLSGRLREPGTDPPPLPSESVPKSSGTSAQVPPESAPRSARKTHLQQRGEALPGKTRPLTALTQPGIHRLVRAA
jgi:hypothetical protein